MGGSCQSKAADFHGGGALPGLQAVIALECGVFHGMDTAALLLFMSADDIDPLSCLYHTVDITRHSHGAFFQRPGAQAAVRADFRPLHAVQQGAAEAAQGIERAPAAREFDTAPRQHQGACFPLPGAEAAILPDGRAFHSVQQVFTAGAIGAAHRIKITLVGDGVEKTAGLVQCRRTVPGCQTAVGLDAAVFHAGEKIYPVDTADGIDIIAATQDGGAGAAGVHWLGLLPAGYPDLGCLQRLAEEQQE